MLRFLKRCYRVCHWVLTVQFGIRPQIAFRALAAFPVYIRDWVEFRRAYDGALQYMPCLHDRRESGGNASSEYFIQDLAVAKRIFIRNPVRHVDVGSRVDGFIAHVASFRTIEVLDIRPTASSISGIVFTQADLMDVDKCPAEYCDSVSCLHALEHFGLGRYGDKVDPSGWRSGLAGLSRLLKPNGRLYLSTPVGRELVMFNAHRIFSAIKLVAAAESCGLVLDNLSWVHEGRIEVSADARKDLEALGTGDYTLTIFEFLKR
jgi:hypothetical protein